MPPVKKSLHMTSYGGIIRIRLKGRSSITSSQPAHTSSPVFISVILYIQFHEKTIGFLKRYTMNTSGGIRFVYSSLQCIYVLYAYTDFSLFVLILSFYGVFLITIRNLVCGEPA